MSWTQSHNPINISYHVIIDRNYSSSVIEIEDTEFVNKKFGLIDWLVAVALLMVTFLANWKVFGRLKGSEKTAINQMLQIDCVNSMIYSIFFAYQHSPWFRGMEVDAYCHVHVVLVLIFATCNRLQPIVVATYR